MKKTIKLLGLLFVAAMLFAGCANGSSSSSDSSTSTNEPLFSESDVTVAATKFEVADGNWIYRAYNKTEQKTASEQFEFTLKNGQVDTSADANYSYISSQEGTIPEGTSQADIEQIKAMGATVSGNKYYYTRQYNKDAIRKLFEKVSTNLSSLTIQELADYMTLQTAISEINKMNNSNTPAGCKTNTEKTKYFWTTQNQNGVTTKNYLAKK